MPGLAIAIPPDYYGRIAPRSGLALKKFIDVGAGVIDSDYRGEIGVVLFNFGNDDFVVNMGDKIAQLIFERIKTPELKETNELRETGREVVVMVVPASVPTRQRSMQCPRSGLRHQIRSIQFN